VVPGPPEESDEAADEAVVGGRDGQPDAVGKVHLDGRIEGRGVECDREEGGQ
jgi:hypothetical protein